MIVDGDINGLAFDWITGNVYAVTLGGYILACDWNTTRSFLCVSVATGLGELIGIALDPVDGYGLSSKVLYVLYLLCISVLE